MLTIDEIEALSLVGGLELEPLAHVVIAIEHGNLLRNRYRRGAELLGLKVEGDELAGLVLIVQGYVGVLNDRLALELELGSFEHGAIGVDARNRGELLGKEVDLGSSRKVSTLALSYTNAHVLLVARLLQAKVEPLGAAMVASIHAIVAHLERGLARSVLKFVGFGEQTVLLVGSIDLELLPIAVGRSGARQITNSLEGGALCTTVQGNVDGHLLIGTRSRTVIAGVPVCIRLAINQRVLALTVTVLNGGDIHGPLGSIGVCAIDNALVICSQNINFGNICSLVLVLLLPVIRTGNNQADLGGSML